MAAAAESPVKDLCDEATCSICLEYFKDPVTIAECGHNFCRSCLSQCWDVGGTRASCPHCRETVQRRNLIPNRQLANFVEITKKLSLRGGKGRVCEKHQEPLKLFCKDHETPICVVCDRSQEHERHKVIPLEEASEEYKGLIRSCLKMLRKEREKILAYQADVEKEDQDLLKLTETGRQKTLEKFRQLRQFLEEQEKQLLNQIEEVEKEIARKRAEHVASLSRKLSSLESIIKEMKEKSEKPASELLQDVRRTLQRYEQRERLENSVAFPQELKRGISEFCDISPLLEGAMKQFKANISMGQNAARGCLVPAEDRKYVKCRDKNQDLWNTPEKLNPLHFVLESANVTLDPNTANPLLALSEDHKSVKLGALRQDLPDNPERFNTIISVLGREGFTAGRHFWEVIVESEGEWAVGVARKSLRRKGSFHLSPEGGIWAVGKWGGEYKAFDPPDVPFFFPRGELKRIRVFLNYEVGEVTFFSPDSGTELYTFSGASFSGETLLPFFYLWGDKTHLRVA